MNTLYTGDGIVEDLPCSVTGDGVVVSEWDLSPEEYEAIINGGNIRLFIYAEPIPPVALAVSDENGSTIVDTRDYEKKEE